jgi:hypothetical protein
VPAAHHVISVIEMETTELNVESSSFVNALERVLPQHGYRTTRSFDLHLAQELALQIPQLEKQCQCGCNYTVLLVFAHGSQADLEGTISVRGIADRSIISLTAPKNDGDLEAHFATILVEAIQIKNSGGVKKCCCGKD